MEKLSQRQQSFVNSYNGNGVEAAKLAGYKGSYSALGVTAFKLLKIPKIVKAIENRQLKPITRHIATREERQAFWTEVMLDKEQRMNDRLKAAELLGRSNADFIERIEQNVKHYEGIIRLPYKKPVGAPVTEIAQA